jgi:ATP-dependent RNA helicase RhlE
MNANPEEKSTPTSTLDTSETPDTSEAESFDAFDLAPRILRGVTDAGFTEPRPIQRDAIPAVLAGRDVLGLAKTGTGKTAAFALPILDGLLRQRSRGPRALVVAPTRELAQQIDAEIRLLGRHIRLQTVTIYGGVSQRPQIAALRQNPDVLVACPGRLLDLYGQGEIDFSRIETLVLDEADHMFDMGFLPDIRRILGALPAERQNLLFSATMPDEIRHLADRMLTDPVVVELSSKAPVSTIEHALYPVEEKQKAPLLDAVLELPGFASAIVFTRTKHRARRLAQQLDKRGHRAAALQGNMSQNARDRAMNGFRKRTFDILVATDIAARGIDVEKVSHVINYDVPTTAEAYTHRIGRTGRAEREGKAVTFITDDDAQMVRAIERMIGARIERRAIEDGEETVLPMPAEDRRPARGRGRGQPSRSQAGRGRSQADRPQGRGRGQAGRGQAGRGQAGRGQAGRGQAGRGRPQADRDRSQTDHSDANSDAGRSSRGTQRRPAASAPREQRSPQARDDAAPRPVRARDHAQPPSGEAGSGAPPRRRRRRRGGSGSGGRGPTGAAQSG